MRNTPAIHDAAPSPRHPSPEITAAAQEAESVKRRLSDLWRQVLEVDAVDGSRDFIEQGGDSIATAQLCREIAKVFSVSIPFSTFAKALTLDAQVQEILHPTPRPISPL